MHEHQGWNVRHGLCSYLHAICIYIWVVYSFCLFCCLFIIVTWWYVWCIVWASGRVEVNSIPKLELQLNSYSNSEIGNGIEIGGIKNGIGIENSGIGIENRNCNQEKVRACLVTLWLFIISCYSLYKATLGLLCSWKPAWSLKKHPHSMRLKPFVKMCIFVVIQIFWSLRKYIEQ